MLVLQHVTKSYGAIRALDDVSFSVEPGEVVAVVGENGAGKSTLVKCIAGAEIPDTGSIAVGGASIGRSPKTSLRRGISVVWQDLALCENLDVAANLFLGQELVSGVGLNRAEMHSATMQVFRDLGVEVPDLSRPIGRLSGGQRQLVAIARATLDQPRVLILDEPTAALGVIETQTIHEVIRTLQADGVAIVLVSHQLDEVFGLADQILVLRHGRKVSLTNRSETHPDDVVAIMAGIEADTTASQQLNRLHSLSEQLADADATAVLPLTVTSLSDAMSCDRLAVFIGAGEGRDNSLQLTAALNLSPNLERKLRTLPVVDPGDFVMDAANTERIVLVPDLRDGDVGMVGRLAAQSGLVGAWAAPIVGQDGTMAVIVGFTAVQAALQTEQMQLLELFSTMAGAAIDRGQLIESLRVNVQSLEGLQGVLEVFAAVEDPQESLAVALDALKSGIGADAALLRVVHANNTSVLSTEGPDTIPPIDALVSMANHDELHSDGQQCAECVSFDWSGGRGEVVAWWAAGTARSDEAISVLHGAANSFRLALERGLVREARQESSNLRASRALERNLTRRLGHELRTPLTAIQGFASTLMQSDVEWADADRRRFTELIEVESERLSRLVDALFDTASMEAGTFLPNLDYCGLTIAAQRARQLIGEQFITLDLPESLTVWADGDRLEQVFINLFGNSVRHNPPGTAVVVSVAEPSRPGMAAVEVRDNGAGLPPDVLAFLNGQQPELGPDRGLGVRLVRGFVLALGGEVVATSSSEGSAITIMLPREPLPS